MFGAPGTWFSEPVLGTLATNSSNNATGMVAAPTGKSGPSKKKTAISSKSKNKNKQQVIVNVSQPPPMPSSESVAAVKNTVSEVLNPTRASLIPRAPRQPLSPAFYPGSLSIKASNVSQPFKGTIEMSPNLDNFITLRTENGGTTSASGASVISNYTDMPGIEIQLGHFYSVPGYVRSSGGAKLQDLVLQRVDETVAEQYHYLDANGELWHTGAIWTVNGTLSSVSSNANFNPVKLCKRGESGVTLVETLRIGCFDAAAADWQTPNDVDTVVGTTSYAEADLTLGSGNFAVALLGKADSVGEYIFYYALGSVDLTLNTNVSTTLPVGPAGSSIYHAIRGRASQFSITRFFGNLAWRGSHAYDAGNVGGALIPHNFAMPLSNADATLDVIGTLPYRQTLNQTTEGVHVAYLPQRVQDLFLLEKGSEIHGNKVVIAFSVPPTGASGQAAAFLFSWGVCVEWLIDDPSVPQCIPPWGEDAFEELISALGDLNPASGNPEHIKKIKEAMQRVSAHPAVKTAADMAWKVTKAGAKAALPMLLTLL